MSIGKNQPPRDTQNDRDRKLKDELGETTNLDNLSYDEEKNSYELDTEGSDPDYKHPDPYDTTAENGEDANSEYDEANPYVGDEYDKDATLESDLDDLGMHVDDGSITRLSKKDEELSRTPEDDRPDLDEEGYPKKDS